MYPVKKMTIFRTMMVLLFLTSVLPLACRFVLSGGEILLWLSRVEEVKTGLGQGQLLLYPSLNLIQTYEGQLTALDTNLFLIFPAAIRLIGGSITTSYRIYMLFLQAGTLIFACLFFRSLFQEEITAMFGVLFYMTFPYRLYICYDKASLGQAVVWMLMPLLGWGIWGLYNTRNKFLAVLASSLAFGAIAWTWAAGVLILYGIIILTAVFMRRIKFLLPIFLGSVLGFPPIAKLIRYILGVIMEEWKMPIGSISANGYFPGQFFTTFAFKENQPGFGMGMMFALLVLLWLLFTENKKMGSTYKAFSIGGILFLVMSLQPFPWDMIQRLGPSVQRAVALMGTPAIFFGTAAAAFCITSAYAIGETMNHDNKIIRTALPVITAAASLASAVYFLNMLIYTRLPLYLTDVVTKP